MASSVRSYSLIVAMLTSASAFGGYSATDLGILPGGSQSEGAALNLFGMVAGTADNSQFQNRAVFGTTGGLTSPGTLPGGSDSKAFAINDGGQITGVGEVAVTTPNGSTLRIHAFLSSNGGPLRDLGVFPGDVGSAGNGINVGGVVAGVSYEAGGGSRAVLAYGVNSFVDLGGLGGLNAGATAINNHNVATGWAQVGSGANHAFVTGPNGLQDLGVLPGFSTSQGQAINLAGQVVGFSGGLGSSSAFLYNPGSSSLVNLGLLPFAISSEGFGINDTGAIVGRVDFSTGPSHAFVIDPATGSMVDVNSLLSGSSNLLITSATGINNRNMIVGTAEIGSSLHAVLLTPIPGQDPFTPPPVPEPSSWLLLLCGGAVVVGWRRRRSA